MIKVSGTATYTVGFELQLDMSEEEWDRLSDRQQNEVIDNFIGLYEMESAEMDDCDVWDVENLEGSK